MKVKYFKKIVSLIASFSILFNSLATPLAVIAQEVSPTPESTPIETTTPEPTVEPTENPTTEPTVESTASPSATPEVTNEPTPTQSPLPTDISTPTNSPQSEATSESQVEGASTESTQASEITTDKEDYHPGETATITGTLFEAFQSLVLRVFGGSDEDGTYTESNYDITSDDLGNFTFSYLLDNIFRPLYTVQVFDTLGSLLAEKTFTDSAIGTYDQCSNDDGVGYATGDTGCRWANGNLNVNNSAYFESDATVQRLWLKGYAPGSSHNVTLQYGTTKGGKHAYDFLTSWNHSEDWITISDLCQDITGCTTGSVDTLSIPSDPNGSGQYEVPGSVFTMHGGNLTTASTPVLGGSYAGDSETSITVSFTVDSSGSMCETTNGKNPVTTCGVALFFGAHISDGAQWGVGTTAVNISGSPYHVSLAAEDGQAIGQRDNQMQADAIVIPIEGNIVVVKETDPDGDPTSFTFNPSWGESFTLSDGQSHDSGPLVAGTYDVSETVPAGWDLTSATCSDGSPVTAIDLAAEETVTCTFNNQKDSAIVVEKQTLPNGSVQSFEFDSSWGNNFNLSDDQTNNSGDLVPGTYSVDELAVSGWDETSAVCSDQSPIEAISLQAGETVTCVFTNTQRGNIVVDKVTNPSGDTQSFDFVTSGSGYSNFSLSDSDAPNSQEVLAGSYTLSETVPAGWDLTSATCDSEETVESLDVEPGETVTCTFTNTKRGHIIIEKNAIPDSNTQEFTFINNFGNANPSSFNLTDPSAEQSPPQPDAL